MVFCVAESLSSRSDPCDISFPQHGELKCNSDDVKHNLKGIKGKPGTTRPADITQFIRKTPTYPNSVELVYALTTKKYFYIVNLVQKKPIETLVNEIKRRKTPFSKERVISSMRSKAEDPDIVATSTNMSLKDPLQMTRIQTPCRGLSCTHNGCFDAAVYLALQEQAPTWTCPICHKPAIWENVAFDHYFADILQQVSHDIEQVTVEPDGRWHQGETPTTEKNAKHGNRTSQDDSDDEVEDDDDDDIVVIGDSQTNGIRDASRASNHRRTPPVNALLSTPQSASSSISAVSAAQPSSAPARPNKRAHAETIDLTLDDSDDDQPPVARVKRPSISSQQSYDSFRSRPAPPEPYHFTMPPPSNSSTPNQRYFQGF